MLKGFCDNCRHTIGGFANSYLMDRRTLARPKPEALPQVGNDNFCNREIHTTQPISTIKHSALLFIRSGPLPFCILSILPSPFHERSACSLLTGVSCHIASFHFHRTACSPSSFPYLPLQKLTYWVHRQSGTFSPLWGSSISMPNSSSSAWIMLARPRFYTC